jgi:hypothetical protein
MKREMEIDITEHAMVLFQGGFLIGKGILGEGKELKEEWEKFKEANPQLLKKKVPDGMLQRT